MGANVTGIEPQHDNISAAIAHAQVDPVVAERTTYLAVTAEELASSGLFHKHVASDFKLTLMDSCYTCNANSRLSDSLILACASLFHEHAACDGHARKCESLLVL